MQATQGVTQQIDQLRAAQNLHRQMQVMQQHRLAVKASGLPALQRLVTVAQRDTGQSAVVGRFLLGLYNGRTYPFNLTELRGLDQELHSDCMAVLIMDWSPEREVHEMISDGHRIWDQFIARWGKRS